MGERTIGRGREIRLKLSHQNIRHAVVDLKVLFLGTVVQNVVHSIPWPLNAKSLSVRSYPTLCAE